MAPSSKAESGLVFSGAVSTQTPPASRSSKPRIGGPPGAKTGTPTPQHVQMELKQRILAALGRLADRDTQQIGIEELDKLVETISPDCVAVFLSCLYDSEMQQKSVVKKECVRLFSSLASLHADLLVPHLTKIIASIMRRLRDPDNSVRDACVDAIASLSARMLCPPSSSSSGLEKENGTQNASALTLATFSKPLFDALSEQNKSVQTGAALCLARVIESAKSPPLSALARLCPRICKFMSNPNFLARPALLGVLGSLSQVGAINQQQLALVMPCVYEALESNDWATRKAAAETLSRVGMNLGPALLSFKPTTLQVLESSRFDKVKPVRDGISDAAQVWKNLPGVESVSGGVSITPDGAEQAVSMQRLELRSHKGNNFTATQSPVNESKPESSPSQLLKSSEKPLEAVKKRVPLLTDKKLNPEFFQKLAEKDADDWQIEVAVPRSFPPQNSQDTEFSVTEGHLENGSLVKSSPNAEQLAAGKDTPGQYASSNGKGLKLTSTETRSLTIDENSSSRTHGLIKLSAREVVLDRRSPKNSQYPHGLEESGRGIDLSSNGIHSVSNEKSRWQVIQKQLTQLEQQQSNLLQMVQDVMVSSQENMSVLKARIWDLENVVESLVGDVGFSGSKNFKVAALALESNGVRLPGRYTSGSEYANSRFNKNGDGFRLQSDRVNGPDVISKSLRHNAQKFSDTSFDDWDEFSYRGPLAGAHVLDGQPVGRRPNDISKVEREDTGVSHSGIRRLWDRVPGAVRLGEGPSARSVWQASKDEATLAAIRVAGEDSELSETEAHSNAVSQLALPNSETGSSRHKAANGYDQGKGQYWSLWGSAMEFVQAGDMESAYTEVLCAEDERMLVRLMSRTGPVLDQLTVTTASEVLHAIGALLQHQSYFDFCLCWIQQVADMVAGNGSDCLDISLDAKKELLMALQETSSMGLPDGWLGSSIDELLQQLALAWSIDIEPVETEM